MHASKVTASVVSVVLLGSLPAGCTTAVVGERTLTGTQKLNVTFQLEGALSEYTVEPGTPAEAKGTGSFQLSGGAASGGSLTIDLTTVLVSPTRSGGGKGSVNAQVGDTVIVTAWLAPIEDLETVCGSDVQVGPYTITLDENSVPVSIDPSEVTLSDEVLTLINTGEFSICIRVESTIAATITIEALEFQFSVG